MNEKDKLIIVEAEFDHIFDGAYSDIDNFQELDISYTIVDRMIEEMDCGADISSAEVEKATLEFLKQGGKIRRGE